MSEKIPLKFIYGPHGEFNNPDQDRIMEEIFPSFYHDAAINVLGVEDVGTFTDEERDFSIRQARNCPTVNSFVNPAERTQNPFLVKEALSVGAFTGMGGFLNRQRLLLNKWNRDNPNKIVIPYPESTPTEADKEAENAKFEKTCIIIDTGEKMHWKKLTALLREQAANVIDTGERDENFLRIINDLPKVLGIQSGIRCQVLFSLGDLHDRMTDMVADKAGDKFEPADPYYFGMEGEYGSTLCQRLLAKGEKISDEFILRNVFHDYILRHIFAVLGDPSAFHEENRAFKKRLMEAINGLSLKTVCEMQGLSFEEDGNDETPKVKSVQSGVYIQDQVKGSGKRLISEEYRNFVNSLRPGEAYINRSNHPNNRFMDKQHVMFTLAATMGLTDSKDGCLDLIRQALDSIERAAPGQIEEFRKELINESIKGTHRYFLKAQLMDTLAKAPLKNNGLWIDRSKDFKTGRRLRKLLSDAMR